MARNSRRRQFALYCPVLGEAVVMVRIEQLDGSRWRVTVQGATETVHEVTVPDAYCRQLAGGEVDVEVLLEKSFEFLLARESNTSILRRFDLPVIGRYFPEYEQTIGGMLAVRD